MKKVSFILAVHNAEKTIIPCVESIVNQTYREIELILVDDYSSDNTTELLSFYNQEYINIHRNNIRLGLTKSLNIAISKSTGDYLARIDADDIATLDRIEKQVKFMDANPEIGVCGTFIEYFGDKNQVYTYPTKDQELKANLLFDSCFAHPSVMIRRQVLEDNQIIYDEEFTYAQDYKLWVDLMDKTTFAVIPEVLLRYRIHNNQIGNTHKEKQLFFASKAREILTKKVYPEISESEWQLFQDFKEKKLPFVNENFKKLISLLEQIEYSNTKTNVLNSRELHKILVQKFYANFFSFSNFSLKDIWKYLRGAYADYSYSHFIKLTINFYKKRFTP